MLDYPSTPAEIMVELIRVGATIGLRQQIDAGWSSPVAREAHNLEVVGSNPAPATEIEASLRTCRKLAFFSRVRQYRVPIHGALARDRPRVLASAASLIYRSND